MDAKKKAPRVLQHAEAEAENNNHAGSADRPDNSNDITPEPKDAEETRLDALTFMQDNAGTAAEYAAYCTVRAHRGYPMDCATTRTFFNGRIDHKGANIALNNNWLAVIRRETARELIRRGFSLEQVRRCFRFRGSRFDYMYPDLFPECAEVD